jgi:hypothetical protein
MGADKNCFVEKVLAGVAFDITVKRAFGGPQPLGGEREQPEMIAKPAVPVRWAGPP